MWTKKQLVDMVTERANGGPLVDYRKFHPLVVGGLVDMVLNAYISQEVEKWMVVGGSGVEGDWVKTLTKIPIKWDPYREQCYIEWGVDILFLQGYGVREIGWPASGDARPFSIMPSSSYPIISDLESSEQDENQYMAILEGKRVYFPAMSRVNVIEKRKLMAKVILASASYTDNDLVPVPDTRMNDFLEMIDSKLGPMKAARMKVSNDSNPNTV